ncbi:MAG: hypothetical protein U5N53_11150 [Mycobacterium sp.]|nr:hypothetical protein [Mycobacterium sp.]
MNTSTGLFKLGDGVTPWNALQYFGASAAFAALVVWDALGSLPGVIAAGDTAQQARDAIGAISTEQVENMFGDLIDGAPEARNTLKELSDAWAESDADITTLLGIINAKQAGHVNLTALSGLTNTADRLAYFNGATMVLTALTTVGRNIIGAATNGDVLTTIGAQAADADLALLALLTWGNNTIVYKDNAGALQTAAVSAIGRSMLGATDAAAVNGLLPTGINPQTGTSYTADLPDAQKFIPMTNAAANVFYIPTNAVKAFPLGTTMTIGMGGAGQTSVAAVTPGTTTVRSEASKNKIAAQNATATVIKTDTDEWWLLGALIA